MYDPIKLKNDIAKLEASGYFDADWYVSTYPDVALSSLSPAAHFLKYGILMKRDPGPDFCTRFYLGIHTLLEKKGTNPVLYHYRRQGPHAPIDVPEARSILFAAQDVARHAGYRKAIALAEGHLPDDLRHTTCILRASHAILQDDEDTWRANVNDYLGRFDLAPIEMEPGPGPIVQRMTTAALPAVESGPVVTVIMPAWNAEDTLLHTARSILRQTWRPLEFIIVDDASTDGTWQIAKNIAAEDDRVRIIRNPVNTGPYVAKNIALAQSTGAYITGHDADDWAHPQRIENHMRDAVFGPVQHKASVGYMLRMQPDGVFGIMRYNERFSLDGAARKGLISCLFERRFLTQTLGYWDSVRFGADSAKMAQAEAVLGAPVPGIPSIGMICLDMETSLTNHHESGINVGGKMSDVRIAYRESWKNWHKTGLTPENARLPFLQEKRRYDAPAQMCVPPEDLRRVQREFGIDDAKGHIA